jgi:hypothetical protein
MGSACVFPGCFIIVFVDKKHKNSRTSEDCLMQLSTKISLTSLLLAVALTSASSASAATITQWNFNTPGTPDNNTGTGTTATSVGFGTIATIGGVTNPSFNSGVGSSDPAASDNSGFQTTTYAAQGTNNKTAGIQVNVSTVGFSNVSFTYDLRHSNTSSQYEQVQYSLNGTTFFDIGSLFNGNLGDTWFNGRTINLSSIAGADNNANFALRVVAAFAPSTTTYTASSPTGTYGTTGTWRFDQVTVSGTAVPEPSAAAGLFSLGLVGGAARLVRSRRKVQA